MAFGWFWIPSHTRCQDVKPSESIEAKKKIKKRKKKRRRNERSVLVRWLPQAARSGNSICFGRLWRCDSPPSLLIVIEGAPCLIIEKADYYPLLVIKFGDRLTRFPQLPSRRFDLRKNRTTLLPVCTSSLLNCCSLAFSPLPPACLTHSCLLNVSSRLLLEIGRSLGLRGAQLPMFRPPCLLPPQCDWQ